MSTQDIVDQAFALVPGGSFAQKLLGDYAQTSESRMAQVVQRSRFEWLEEDVGEIKEKVSKLMETVEERDWPTPEDVAAVLQAAEEVSKKTGNAKKRRLLRRAVVNAFDPELYEAGETLALLEVLEGLTYGDVEMLRQLEKVKDGRTLKVGGFAPPRSLEIKHVRALTAAHLLALTQGEVEPARVRGDSIMWVTGHGKLLLKLLREPAEDDPSEE